MVFDIKTIEDLSLNAWPSHQIEVYDGWIIRFSHFYTHRTNSVEQIGPSSIPLPEKVSYCEKIYHRWKTPSIFKITPLSMPLLEPYLIQLGYQKEHSTDVMVLDLLNDYHYNIEETPNVSVKAQPTIAAWWIDNLFRLKNTTNPIHKKIVPYMYAAIPKDVIAVSIRQRNRCIATGLGILDREYIGIYAIHVADEYRHRGYAKAILNTLLTEGIKKGASKAYLQVVSDNHAARTLYERIGFKKLYTYWFRVKHTVPPSI